MRYARVRLGGDGWPTHPGGRNLADAPGVSPTAVHAAGLLADGTGVVVSRLDGEREAALEALRSASSVVSTSLAAVGGGLYGYTRFRPAPRERRMLEIPVEHRVVVDYPLSYAADGGLSVTVLGSGSALRRALAAVPDGVEATVEEHGDATAAWLRSRLARHDRRTLEAAVASGYYRRPRRATCGDVGDELGVSGETVARRLRRAESALLPALAGERG